MADKTDKHPSHRVYSVVQRRNQDDFWLNLGVAFVHEDGEGFNLLLQALPLDGKLVLRKWKEPEPEPETAPATVEEQKPKGKKV